MPSNLKSIEPVNSGDDEKTNFANYLDDMYNALVVEHGVVTTDYSH